MKKTYKPISRTEKASQMFKKKTLNLNDQFSIKHDEDNIENVDEYWETANSVIGNQTIDSIEGTELNEESDTLFDLKNIRKSVQSAGNRNDNNKSANTKSINDNPIKKEKTKRLTLKPGSDDGEDFLEITDSEDKKPEKPQTNFHNKEKEENVENGSFDISVNNSPEIEGGLSAENENDFSNQYKSDSNVIERGYEPIDQEESSPSFDYSIKHETKNKNSSEFNKKTMSKTRASKAIKSRKEIHSGGEGPIVVENVREIGSVNKMKPVVCTDDINTAILELDYMAFTNEENAEKSFSLFVVKGKVVIKSGDKKTVLKNGEATIISKNQLYSIICESKNGASLFISYAL